MSSVVNDERIPNNVDLASDKRLQRALEAWQPNFLSWWKDMGPAGFQADDVYLRTAVAVTQEGWANFDYVKMPDYRWGIFLADAVPDRTIGFGDSMGEPVWQVVPGEHRNTLRRLIVTQGDTEPASVEQQRLLGQSCPSVYDLRNLFQVNVEEGRDLWAMVYLLHNYFGRDGREEAEELLVRKAGTLTNHACLAPSTNRAPIGCRTSCSRFSLTAMESFSSSRSPKAHSTHCRAPPASCSPKKRTTCSSAKRECSASSIRTAEVMAESKKDHPEDVRALGVIDLPTIQRYLNLWYSLSLDLFGGEISSNAASFFATGLKGRAKEEQYDDHRALASTYGVDQIKDGKLVREDVPLRNAMNEVLRDDYVADCQRGVDKWNRTIEARGIPFRLSLPNRKFHRHIGLYANLPIDFEGNLIAQEEWNRKRDGWLPSEGDKAFVRSLMSQPVYDPQKMANWISPPKQGIKGRPVDFAYVRH